MRKRGKRRKCLFLDGKEDGDIYQKRITQRTQRYSEAPHFGIGGRMWWWIIGKVMKNGKIRAVLLGPEPDEESAHRRGYELFRGADYEIKQYPTRVVASATQMWKAQRSKSCTIEDAIENVRHRGKDIGIEGDER